MTSLTTTPILDLQEALPPSKRNRSSLRGFGVGLVIGLLLFLLIPALEGSRWGRLLWPAFVFYHRFLYSMRVWDRQFFLGGLVAFWLAISAAVLVHELGHFVAGRLMGFSLQFLQVGPLSIGYDHGNLRIQYQPNWGVSGHTAMHVSGTLRLRRKLLVYVAAGPLTNLLFVFFGWGVTRNVAADLNILFWSAIQLFSAACLLAFFGSVIPYRSANGFFSDGARLRMLLLPNVETKRWYAIIGLGMQRRYGRRPREWNRRWLALASSSERPSVVALVGKFLSYAAANDRKDKAAAGELLESCLRDVGAARQPFRDTLMNEAAVFQAWFRNDAEKAKQWFARVQKPTKSTPLQRTRGAVALLFAKGDAKTAFEEWDKGLEQIGQFKDLVQRETLRQSWLEWKQEMEERLGVTATPIG